MSTVTSAAQIRISRTSPACWRITFDNPPLNLMGPQFVREFRTIMSAIDADEQFKVVHWSRVNDVLKQAGNVTRKVIVTCSLPMNARDTGLAIAHTSSGAEALAKKARKAAVVSAFGTVPSEVLFDVFDAKRRRRRRPSLLYCGDNHDAKDVASQLIRDVGFEPIDAGPLRMARYLEPFTLVMAQLAYEGDEGPEVAYRIERFGK